MLRWPLLMWLITTAATAVESELLLEDVLGGFDDELAPGADLSIDDALGGLMIRVRTL